MSGVAVGLSEHPDPADAIAEVCGAVLDELDGPVDLAVLFVARSHREAMADLSTVVRSTLAPDVLVGSTTTSVLAGERSVEDQPAVALFAAHGLTARARRFDALGAGHDILGADSLDGAEGTLVLFTEPASFPTARLVEQVAERSPQLTVIGGVASAGLTAGDNSLLLDDTVYDDGAVGVLLAPDSPVRAVVSQGCRPIGEPLAVTVAAGNVIDELGGRPALDRLAETLASLDATDADLARVGLQLGLVIDQRRVEFGPDDFVTRDIVGGVRERGSLVIADTVPVGSLVQFQVRDPASARDSLLSSIRDEPALGALLFSGSTRTLSLLGESDHDVALVRRHTLGGVVAGMGCSGELGPVGGRSWLHGFSASVLLFDP